MRSKSHRSTNRFRRLTFCPVVDCVYNAIGTGFALRESRQGALAESPSLNRLFTSDTQQDNLWFHGGNLHQSRHYSLYLALQLKARMEGIDTPVYGMGEVHHLG